MMQFRKLLQRKIYNSLNSNWFLSIILVGVFTLLTIVSLSILSQESCSLRGNHGTRYFCSIYNFQNNIGGINSEQYTAFEPIDVVYTWVNGSDPVWRKKKEWWAKKTVESKVSVEGEFPSTNTTLLAANSTTELHLNSSYSSINGSAVLFMNTSGVMEEEDDTMSSNRYRDSEELRFSLRSLVKNAPWIRHIYLVTDNQIPYWLNLETSKLSIVTHEEIFANKSHLPVFSSPAIEANLHRIPGLSKKFIYFNDDVMLGSTAVPDDFVTLSGAQKFYMAWDVPKCAPGCSDSWIGDGFCDKACNVSACNFDFPDCINGSNVIGNNAGSSYSSNGFSNRASVQCSKGCPTTWLADKICDIRCKNEDCGWDMGDCGLNLIVDNYPGVALSSENAVLSIDETFYSAYRHHYYSPQSGDFEDSAHDGETFGDFNYTDYSSDGGYQSDLYSELLAGYSDRIDKVALEVPVGTKSVYFNLSYLPCRMMAHNLSCPDLPLLNNLSSDFSYTSAEHNDFDQHIIHHSVLLQKHHTLVVTLFHGQKGVPDDEDSLVTIPAYPYVIEFTVVGGDQQGQTVMMIFKLVVVEKSKSFSLEANVPENLGLLEGTSYSTVILPDLPASQPNSSALDRVHVLPVPFRTVPHQSEFGDYEIWEDSSDTVVYREIEGAAEGVIIEYDLPSLALIRSHHRAGEPLHKEKQGESKDLLIARVLVSLRNDSSFLAYTRFCDLLLQYMRSVKSDDSKTFLAASSEESEEGFGLVPAAVCQRDPDDLWQLMTANYYSKFQVSALYKLLLQYDEKVIASSLSERMLDIRRPSPSSSETLDSEGSNMNRLSGLFFVPLPMKYQEFESDWVQVKVELFETNISHFRPLVHCSSLFKLCWEKVRSSDFSYSREGEITRMSSSERVWSIETLFRWGTNLSTVISETDLPSTSNDTLFANSSANIMETNASSPSVSADTSIFPNSTADTSQPIAELEAFPAAINESSLFTEERSNMASTRRLSSSSPSFFSILLRSVVSLIRTASLYWNEIFSHTERVSKHRRLTDTYGQSLIHVNRMYNKVFGVESRKVPAHVPHMIDREIMSEMQDRWSSEWNDTSSHRFRSTTDMQYSFSYYYYAINRHKIAALNAEEFVRELVDHNGDQVIDPNEFRTLVTIVKGKQLEPGDIETYRECVRNASLAERSVDFEETRVYEHHRHGKLAKSVSYLHYPTIPEVLNCSLIQSVLQENKDLVKRLFLSQMPIVGSDRDVVAFEMIGDNLTETLSQLDSVRHRQSKFICINDNMKSPSEELEQVLRDFYVSLFPTPSIFELPSGHANPTLYLDEYMALRRQRQRYLWYYFLTEDLFEWCGKGRDWALSALKHTLWYWIASLEEMEEEGQRADEVRKQHHSDQIISKLRKDLARDPLTEPLIRTSDRYSHPLGLNHFHLFLSVVGVLLFVFLRRSISWRKKEVTFGYQDEVEDDLRGRVRSRSSSLAHQTIISSEAEEPTENQLYAINKLGADEYAWALRVAAMEELDETALERDYFLNEHIEEESELSSSQQYVADTATASLSKKKKRNKKKKSLELKEE